MKFTGRDGILRIYDSSLIPAKGAQANMSVFVYDASGPTFTDKTAEAYADDTSYTGNFWADTSDKIYVGASYKFAMIQFLSNVLAVGAGTLIAKYYNGSSWEALTVSDGTASGGNTFAQNGNISWAIPKDWAVAGDASLTSTHYYVELAPTSVPGTKPDADILAPVDGQFFKVKFAKMDFSGPIGRGKTEELLVLDRDTMDTCAHYIEGGDSKIYEPLGITFSAMLDDTCNWTYLEDALKCGNFDDSSYWTTTGVSTKGDTQNNGSSDNPTFADTNKKTVNIQMIFEKTTGTSQGWAYYEVYFPPEEITITESEESVDIAASGAVFGVIERIHGLGNRYT